MTVSLFFGYILLAVIVATIATTFAYQTSPRARAWLEPRLNKIKAAVKGKLGGLVD